MHLADKMVLRMAQCKTRMNCRLRHSLSLEKASKLGKNLKKNRLGVCLRRSEENSDNARACEQIAANVLQSPVMPLSTVESWFAHALHPETLRFPRVLLTMDPLIRPVPFSFRRNAGLVPLDRQLAFWINLLLIGNARAPRAQAAICAPHASHVAGSAFC